MGRAYWLRTALPHAGGIAEQDARLVDTLGYLRLLSNELVREDLDRRRRQQALEEWRRNRKSGD
jgi:hypothetical protein